MSIDYTKLPRLAELCEAISKSAGLSVGFEIDYHVNADCEITIYNWGGYGRIKGSYKISTYRDPMIGTRYTLDDVLVALELINDCEFRDELERAA